MTATPAFASPRQNPLDSLEPSTHVSPFLNSNNMHIRYGLLAMDFVGVAADG